MNLENRDFMFCRMNGEVLVRHMRLLGDRYIEGHNHSNETYWDYQDNQLFFKDDQGNVTTTFHTLINLDGKLICLGSVGDIYMCHILVERNLLEPVDYQTQISIFQNLINQQSTQIKQVLSDVSLRSKRIEQVNSGKIKVVFLVHNTASWDSLHDVYHEMVGHNSFEVIVVSIPRCFPGESSFQHEEETHNFLTKAKIPHIRLIGSSNDNLMTLKYINPNAVFRQAPWDNDISPEWSIDSLEFTNIFYVPYYGFNVVESISDNPNEINFHADLDFHKSCAQIFFESELIKKLMVEKSSRGGDNFIVTGHPKLERLANARYKTPYWPIDRKGKNITKIIWAPHHSFTGDKWLSFGLFKEVYQDMLAWVKEDKTIDVVLKPHPALFSTIIGKERIIKEDFQSFIDEWSAQPNATIVEGGDYSSLMAGSDIMLTDGISFLAEYMLFWEKPLVFMRNKKHAKFNVIGQMLEDATYIVDDVDGTRVLLNNTLSNRGDEKQKMRKEVFKELIPYKEFGPYENEAAKRIVESVRRYFIK